jgi:hypothetical protein
MTLGIASIDDGNDISSEVLSVCIKNREKDGGIEAKLGFGGGAEASYRLEGVGGFIRCVELPAVDPVPRGAPPSCLEARGRRRPKGYLGRAACWASWWAAVW